jgi:Flp pilus assembly pilin Flp
LAWLDAGALREAPAKLLYQLHVDEFQMGTPHIVSLQNCPCRPARVSRGFQRGVTSIEYALIATLIGIAIVVGAGALGEANLSRWSSVVEKVVAVVSR